MTWRASTTSRPSWASPTTCSGTARTAVKASLSKYVEQLTYTGTYGDSANPAQRTVQSVTRQWNDIDADFIPDCDLINPLQNGECLQITNLAFGNPVPSTTYNPDILRGWGKRGYNWETSVSVQHELLPEVSVDVGYFRRWYGNFLATDNRALAPADFTGFSVTAPPMRACPTAAATSVTGLYNVTQAGFTRPPDNLLTFAGDYGTQTENWHGVDVSVNARLRDGLVVQGGISTGRRLTDSCEIRAALPEATPLNPYCRIEEPFLTQFKGLAAYTVPRIGVQLAGTFQSIPGPVVQANVVYPAAALAPALGRPYVGGATAVVNVIATGDGVWRSVEPGGLPRRQADSRRQAAHIAERRSLQRVQRESRADRESQLCPFRQPLSVLNPRLVKFSAQLDF